MIVFHSFQERLTGELTQIEEGILDLWRKTEITEFRNDPNSSVFFVVHPYYWKELPIQYRADQAKLLGRYRHWYELFSRCHTQYSCDVHKNLERISAYIVNAIELKSDWATADTFDENRAQLVRQVEGFRALLQQRLSAEPGFTLIPDTNALLKCAEVGIYRTIIEADHFRFVIVPTVLAELDGLKRTRSGQSVGEKAERAIRVIKGLRQQGSVLSGVTVSKTITVQMIATEPRMADLPSWLDAENQDDRIIGSVLEIQCAEPAAVVVLVTDDVNLQNKAEMAFLPWAEPPEAPRAADSSK
jgi:rRNA-processing protein FCF1